VLCHTPISCGSLLLREDAVARDRDGAGGELCSTWIAGSMDGSQNAQGQAIAPRVSSSQPPLALAWHCASALNGASEGGRRECNRAASAERDDQRDSDVAERNSASATL
jgi:hypothetical protein